ncbi:BcPKS16, polyketide synthase [Mytilinidion resinicola]|uniref:BcPKS16, polyketide synthase n=1 Tax=Mytilinidion resinicola TaxID=574789 RepID=A0A6A6Z7U2_9PEZI|nr:BcPKS16, polyketide synthase [Mytilinidion resinicola]KAF2816384.1 BcPKS16, polyketide synthase [Mytilinidion resinicola]
MSKQISAAFFNPQSRAPTPEYLSGLYSFLSHHPHGKTLLSHVATLGTIWPIWAAAREEVRTLPNGLPYLNVLVDWAKGGPSAPVSEARSGVVALPLLTILQLGQYFRYLEFNGLSHAQFISQTRDAGGIQGCCGGEPPALSIALAKDEAQVVENAAVFLRLLVGVGAYIEAMDDWTSSEPTIIAIRLKHEGMGDELMRKFPGTYVSAITEPKSLSFVGSADAIARLYDYCCEQGLPADKMDVTGKAHNPENSYLVPEFLDVLTQNPSLFKIPDMSKLQVTVRSNRTGEKLSDDSIIEDLIIMMLAACCDWYALLSRVAEDMKASGRPSHHMVIFGLNDSVPLSPFNKQRLKISKFKAHELITEISGSQPFPSARTHRASINPSTFPNTAIAIVGVACRLPGANNLEELWEFISKGGDAHQELPKDRIDPGRNFRLSQDSSMGKNRFFGNFLSDIKRFDNSVFGINPKEAASLDPQMRMLLELSYEALESSGYLSSHVRNAEDAVGCFIGSSLNEYHENTSSHAPSAYTATGTIRAFLCGRLSYQYGWQAPSEVIDTACSSSLVAVNRACHAIKNGECDMAIAGGANALTTMTNFLDLGKAGFLSTTGQCKPFDASADGYCRAEGAGLVVLKKLSQAIDAGDEIFGVIPSIATNQGGTSTSLTVPSAPALKTLYQNILRKAGLEPSQVSYIETHGTGTQAGDPIEMDSIRSVFGSASRSVPLSIGSIKGNIGHCEAAAGVAGLLKVLAMIKYGGIPPQANHNRLNPKIPPIGPDGMEINRSLRSWDVPLRTAMVNSYGAGGSNCALLCCELPPGRTVATRPQHPGVSYPVIISAASRASLISNARAVAAYLSKNVSQVELANISFSLQRRKRHRFCFDTFPADVPSLIRVLDSIESPTFEYPNKSKPVVLVLSGQYDSKVALDRGMYELYPIFRSYIDACDSEIVQLGYPSILGPIFQTTPIASALSLQCSIFAVQYACARCWIDSGLKPDAIIGHSFGELVALAVSGALSLPECLNLVAFRSHLVDSRWGAEKGAMLAIHSGLNEVQKLASWLDSNSPGAKLEVACYNASASTVVAGVSSTIDMAERVLSTEADFVGLKFQRLSTTHAFHSFLTEPILPELEELSTSLKWNQPTIPLETCTIEGLSSMRDWSLSRHAREPVYFVKAIERVEQRLGSCVFIEAGLSTPAIPMTRRACTSSIAHTFQAVSTKSRENPWDCVGAVVSDLWRCGISVSHWAFLGASSPDVRQLWLPPYQFEKHQHWIENIDRAMEAQQRLLANPPSIETKDNVTSPPVPRLVLKKESPGSDPRIVDFSINTNSERFRKVVTGHAVLQQPLCPAPMHLECCTMAIQILIGDVEAQNLTFEDLQFQAALGLDPAREVELRLEELVSKRSWKFTVRSTLRGSKTVHCIGTASLSQNMALATYGRLVESTINRLENCETVERLMSNRAYGLFRKVMEYAPYFKGITSIAVDRNEALAAVKLPEGQPGRDESTSWQRCDAVLIDAFISGIGLLLNTSESASEDEVLIAVGIERVVLTPDCQMGTPHDWLVYSKFMFTEGTQPIGDVFVCSAKREVVAMMAGVQFAKLDMSKFRKSLMSANSSISPRQVQHSAPQVPHSDQRQLTTVDVSSSGTTSTLGGPTPSEGDVDTGIKEIISNFTGLHRADIPPDSVLVDLGIDSLSTIEFAAEIHQTFGIELLPEELGSMTLNDLNQRLGNSARRENQPRGDSNTQVDTGNANGAEVDTGSMIREIISNFTGLHPADIPLDTVLVDLGIDSLSTIEFATEFHQTFGLELRPEDLGDLSLDDLIRRLGKDSSNVAPAQNTANPAATSDRLSSPHTTSHNPFDALLDTDFHFEEAANRRGYANYHSKVFQVERDLTLAYILEAFQTLGVDVLTVSPGSVIPPVPHIPKHNTLMSRLWEILQSHGIAAKHASIIIRGRATPKIGTSTEIYEAMTAQFPLYIPEAKAMKLMGEKLAPCLKGDQDPLSLMFGTPTSNKIMEDYYSISPMVSTLTDQLVTFITTLCRKWKGKGDGPLRILEVGAGTGGTTVRLIESLQAAGITRLEYTFTDIAGRMVSKAKAKLGKFPGMSFEIFDLEKEVKSTFRNRFDIVIGTNCVHATTSRLASCRRLWETLNENGVVVLSEGTQPLDWFDICFGLLDGWWLAENGTEYPLQPASKWMETFQAAGFLSSSFSGGLTQEAFTQQLLVASKAKWPVRLPISPVPTSIDLQSDSYRLETMVYKEANGVRIHADVYVPRQVRASPLPIALMIHGGGFMMLSRKQVRPAQTKHLISRGFLPVSIDYRLCPEVNMIDGPMADVRDGYRWVREKLASDLRERTKISVDNERIVVVGWSTGGHLAMSTGWTTREAGIPPPTAILSFYAPVDFESGELDPHVRSKAPQPRLNNTKRILDTLPQTPITNYDTKDGEDTPFFGLQPGDPRSDLLLSATQDGTALALLLNGRTPSNGRDCFAAPSPSSVAAISPLAQARQGNYNTPTYIIHSPGDEVAPFAGAERLIEELKMQGVECGLLRVDGASHLHDLHLRPGMEGWEEHVVPGYTFLKEAVSSFEFAV